MIEKISKSKISVIASLGQKKMRQRHRLFSIEGDKSVRDILFDYPNRFEVEYIAASAEWLDKNSHSLREIGLQSDKTYCADSSELKKASSLSTAPDVIAVCRLPEEDNLEKLLSERQDHSLPLRSYLLLDGIQDPGNLGTIIRTAHWFGIDTIFASRQTADCYNPKVIQSSMGSMAAVNVIYTDLPKLIDTNPLFPVLGLLLEGENIYKSVKPGFGFIVMGNEGSGLSEEMRLRVTLPLTIPPSDPTNHAESLNVAVATGITLALLKK